RCRAFAAPVLPGRDVSAADGLYWPRQADRCNSYTTPGVPWRRVLATNAASHGSPGTQSNIPVTRENHPGAPVTKRGAHAFRPYSQKTQRSRGERAMKTRFITPIVGLSLLALAATACGTATGAAAGAVVGAGTGYGAGKGALIGAGVGAAGGAIYDITKLKEEGAAMKETWIGLAVGAGRRVGRTRTSPRAKNGHGT